MKVYSICLHASSIAAVTHSPAVNLHHMHCNTPAGATHASLLAMCPAPQALAALTAHPQSLHSWPLLHVCRLIAFPIISSRCVSAGCIPASPATSAATLYCTALAPPRAASAAPPHSACSTYDTYSASYLPETSPTPRALSIATVAWITIFRLQRLYITATACLCGVTSASSTACICTAPAQHRR